MRRELHMLIKTLRYFKSYNALDLDIMLSG